MLKLNQTGIEERSAWENAGFCLPKFDRDAVRRNTKERPSWIHFGAGNIFRAFPAALLQQLLEEGKADTGLIVAEGYDYEIIEKMNKPHDDLSLLVTLKANGSIEKTVIGSIVESLTVNSENDADWNRLKEVFCCRYLQMVSFTITEKGYSLHNSKNEVLPDVEADWKAGPEQPKSYIGKLAALLYERFRHNALPLALVSMDNCSHNGSKLYEAVIAFAREWAKSGLVEADFEAYLDSQSVSFPWSMIDKITPRPDESVRIMLEKSGFDDINAVITSKNTYAAPFVNAEESQYLVIEDAFPNGRPALEETGVIFTDRETVDKVEKMKVCTCLNPLHTALAVFGCLLSYTAIYKEMKDPELRHLVQVIGYKEGLPVVVNPGIIDPKQFIDEVLNVRIPNPFMPDTPQRIATDTSQKLPIRFGETIKAYQKREDLDVKNLTHIPLVLAGWCRYLMGIDDNGRSFELSADPMLTVLCPSVSGIKLGDKGPFHTMLAPILSNSNIFSVDLYEVGLGEVVEEYFSEMVSGIGAVRNTLKKYVEME